MAACCFFEVIGIINHYVLEFRGRILFPLELTAIRTAVNVVDEYDFTPDRYIWGTLALMLLYFLVLKLFAVPQPERSYFKKKTITWIMGALSAAYIVAFFFTGWLPAARHQDPAVAHPVQWLCSKLHHRPALQPGGQAQRLLGGNHHPASPRSDQYPYGREPGDGPGSKTPS